MVNSRDAHRLNSLLSLCIDSQTVSKELLGFYSLLISLSCTEIGRQVSPQEGTRRRPPPTSARLKTQESLYDEYIFLKVKVHSLYGNEYSPGQYEGKPVSKGVTQEGQEVSLLV